MPRLSKAKKQARDDLNKIEAQFTEAAGDLATLQVRLENSSKEVRASIQSQVNAARARVNRLRPKRDAARKKFEETP